MIELKNINITSDIAKQLHCLFEQEWPGFDAFVSDKHGIDIPSPIVAIKMQEVVGGISFTSYKEPNSNNIAIWVNALLVIPKQRKQGISKQLIGAAQNVTTHLYALTNVPRLYTKMGWQTVKTHGKNTIVKYAEADRVEK